MLAAWALVVTTWFRGLSYAPVLYFSSEDTCRKRGQEIVDAFRADHIQPPAARFLCVADVVAPGACNSSLDRSRNPARLGPP